MWSWARYPLVSPVWTSRLRLSNRRAWVETIASRRLGHEDVRHDRREPRPRAEEHPVGLADRRAGLVGAAAGPAGARRTPCTRPRVDATRCCPRTMVTASGYAGSWPTISASIVERDAGHRQHPAAGVEQPADEVQAVDGVAEQVPQRHDEEVAEGVAGQRPLALEPVLQHVPPGVAPLGVVAERGERHPQVARRQHRELLAQPPRRPAVVGDRDHGGDPVGEQLQRGERRRQAVAPAEGDDRGVRAYPLPAEGHGALTPARGRGGRGRCRRCRCAAARPAARRWRPTGACRRCSRRASVT